jgi:hypothetical protein
MLRNVARLVFREPAAPLGETPQPVAADRPPMVDLFAYGEDCILSGRIALTADRLTDVLNDHDEYALVDVLVESLVDGHAVETPEVVVRRDELLLVHIVGPRGDVQRRQRTRQHLVELTLGPFLIRGYLHALPGSDAIASLRHRRAMVPLTDARIQHFVGGVAQRRYLAAVLVNREQIDSIVTAHDDETEMPDIPFGTAKGPLVKDFTGTLRADDDVEDVENEA